MELPEGGERDGERVFIVKLTSSYSEGFVSSLGVIQSEWLKERDIWPRVPLGERTKGGSAGLEMTAKNWSRSSRVYPCENHPSIV